MLSIKQFTKELLIFPYSAKHKKLEKSLNRIKVALSLLNLRPN